MVEESKGIASQWATKKHAVLDEVDVKIYEACSEKESNSNEEVDALPQDGAVDSEQDNHTEDNIPGSCEFIWDEHSF